MRLRATATVGLMLSLAARSIASPVAEGNEITNGSAKSAQTSLVRAETERGVGDSFLMVDKSEQNVTYFSNDLSFKVKADQKSAESSGDPAEPTGSPAETTGVPTPRAGWTTMLGLISVVIARHVSVSRRRYRALAG